MTQPNRISCGTQFEKVHFLIASTDYWKPTALGSFSTLFQSYSRNLFQVLLLFVVYRNPVKSLDEKFKISV